MGSGKWRDDYTQSLAGKHVVLIPDNDEEGRIHMVRIASALEAVAASVKMLDLPPARAWMNVVICLSVCVGLSGLAIGLGARFPMLTSRNPARIASGFGGTVNLIVSMLFVGLEMAGVGWLTFELMANVHTTSGVLTSSGWMLLYGLVGVGAAVAVAALWIGVRHFERLEI